MRLLGYVRVSTDEQASTGHGLSAQRTALAHAADGRGWTLLDTLADEGQSAKTLDRPALQQALTMIARKQADGLAVAKLDRLTRSVIDFSTLLDWFERAGATLVALDFDLDTSTPGGRLIAHIMSAVAEWERDMIVQRTREGLAARRARGLGMGRPALSDRPELAEEIVALRDAGMSLRQICEHLEHERVPTARGGARWRPSSVETVLGYRRKVPARSVSLPRV